MYTVVAHLAFECHIFALVAYAPTHLLAQTRKAKAQGLSCDSCETEPLLNKPLRHLLMASCSPIAYGLKEE